MKKKNHIKHVKYPSFSDLYCSISSDITYGLVRISFFSDKTDSHTLYPLFVSTSASLSNTRKWLLPIAGSITIVAPSLHPNMENRRRIINRADIFPPWMSQRWTNVTKVNRGRTMGDNVCLATGQPIVLLEPAATHFACLNFERIYFSIAKNAKLKTR